VRGEGGRVQGARRAMHAEMSVDAVGSGWRIYSRVDECLRMGGCVQRRYRRVRRTRTHSRVKEKLIYTTIRNPLLPGSLPATPVRSSSVYFSKIKMKLNKI
jgi:hypothetical protein